MAWYINLTYLVLVSTLILNDVQINGEKTFYTANKYGYCCPTSRIIELENEKVIPDVISCSPKYIADVSYCNYVHVCLGNELTPAQAQDQPYIYWPSVPGAYYTLILTDPDAPEDPQFAHWIVGNIKGCNVNSGKTYFAYTPPSPPPGSGLHRYIFVVFLQPHGPTNYNLPYIASGDSDGRSNFNAKNFAKKNKLRKVIAMNFFKAQYQNTTQS